MTPELSRAAAAVKERLQLEPDDPRMLELIRAAELGTELSDLPAWALPQLERGAMGGVPLPTRAAAGVIDKHGHLHSPTDGQFIKKLGSQLGSLFGGGKKLKATEPAKPVAPPKKPFVMPELRPRGGPRAGEVRRSLAGAGSISTLNDVASAEARRIAGRDIPFDFEGSDLDIAREHAEGVLRGLEAFPTTRLTRVSMADGKSPGSGKDAWGWLVTHVDGGYQGIPYREDYEIVFARDWAKPESATRYRETLERDARGTPRMGRGKVNGTPLGVGLHETGHAVAHSAMADRKADKMANAFADAHTNRDEDGSVNHARHRMYIGNAISIYANENDNELSAEAFADVLSHGDEASELSRAILDMFEDEIAGSYT